MPQGGQLHRLAFPGGDDPVPDLGVHPGQLPVPDAQEAVLGVDPDPVARPPHVPLHDLLQDGEEGLDQRPPQGAVDHVHRPDVPQGGVRGVVVRLREGGPAVGEAVGEHPLIDEASEGAQDVPRLLPAPRGGGEPGEGDHGVPAPVPEPVVAGDHRLRRRALRRGAGPAGRPGPGGPPGTAPPPGAAEPRAARLPPPTRPHPGPSFRSGPWPPRAAGPGPGRVRPPDSRCWPAAAGSPPGAGRSRWCRRRRGPPGRPAPARAPCGAGIATTSHLAPRTPSPAPRGRPPAGGRGWPRRRRGR